MDSKHDEIVRKVAEHSHSNWPPIFDWVGSHAPILMIIGGVLGASISWAWRRGVMDHLSSKAYVHNAIGKCRVEFTNEFDEISKELKETNKQNNEKHEEIQRNMNEGFSEVKNILINHLEAEKKGRDISD